jgi:hypothetical protein
MAGRILDPINNITIINARVLHARFLFIYLPKIN